MLFDGQKFAQKKIKELEPLVVEFQKKKGRPPKAVFVLVGENPEGEVFVRQKVKVGEEIGVEIEVKRFVGGSVDEAINLIRKWGKDKRVDGIVIQLPIKIPSILHITYPILNTILDAIPPKKDIDGLTSVSFEKLKAGQPCFWPAVVKATFAVIDYYQLLKPDSVVAVVGARGWVGQRLAAVFKSRKTSHLLEIDLDLPKRLGDLKQVDLAISCIGRPGLIQGNMTKKGVAIIDLGTMVIKNSRPLNTQIVGDVNSEVVQVASFFTPVPGGIGPVTIACLFENLLDLYKYSNTTKYKQSLFLASVRN